MGLRYGSKDTAEEYNRLSIHDLNRKGLLKAGASITSTWSRAGITNRTINGYVTESGLILFYIVRAENLQYTVPFTWTECNYGGKRRWFICPNNNCKRRVGTLYGGKYFLCRHCHNLSYRSRNEKDAFRLLNNAQNIHERLGGSGNLTEGFPAKPKGMHWKTYFRLWHKAQVAWERSVATTRL